MPRKQSLADQWEDFSLRVGLHMVSSTQRKEMRRAFYAGAASLLTAMMVGFTEDHEPTAEDLAYMDSIHMEMMQFGYAIANGEA